ncbi:sialate:O-sulfotransferase 1-like [Montipora capricornis]|uniref:sialate:O-sulfotransferase 1-like n=1 Tax=Montipora foliosa TaxID=591990 RepID=UPI0035F16F03
MRVAVIVSLVLIASSVTSYEYLGCYEDSDPRDLPQRVHGREITVRSCAKSCKDLYYRYAGLQFSYLCFCGNKRGRYGMLPEWKCSSECSNKKDKHCGGYWSNSIYKTGYDPPGNTKITPLLKAALRDLKPKMKVAKHKERKMSKKGQQPKKGV